MFDYSNPLFTMTILGLGITLFNQVVWTTIPYTISENHLVN